MNIYQKLVEVRKTVPYLQKANEGQQYSYVSSGQVISAVRQKMDELNLLIIPSITDKNVLSDMVEKKDKYENIKHTTTYFTELKLEYEIVNADNPEEKIKCPFYAQGVDIAGEKGVGKALTYAEKYFFMKLFNIATDKDDPDAYQQKQEQTMLISAEQKNEIESIWKNNAGSLDGMADWINKYFRKTIEKLTQLEAQSIISKLSKSRKKENA